MSSAIAQPELAELASRINSLFAECEEAIATVQNAEIAALETARECGLLLTQAKQAVPWGGWEAWRKENLKHPCTGKELPSSTATLYQRVADEWPTIAASGVRTLREAAKLLKKPREVKAISQSETIAPQPEAEPQPALLPEEVAVLLPTRDKETVMRNWEPEFGALILELAAQGIQPDEATASETYLSAKYPAAAKLESLSGRKAMIIKDAAAAIGQGGAWLQHQDMAGMLKYKSQQYFLPQPKFEEMATRILQKYAPIKSATIAPPVADLAIETQSAPLLPTAPNPLTITDEIAALVDRAGASEFALAATLWLRGQGYRVIEPLKIEAVEPIADSDEVDTAPTLEAAILFLARRCDGAQAEDGMGFNGADTGYGHWLADRIEQGKSLLRKWAESALKMLRKYQKTQLGYALPDWEEVADRYPESFQAEPKPTIESSEYRIELHEKHVAAFSPYGEIDNSIYKSISGYAWTEPVIGGWNFPIAQAGALVEALKAAGKLDLFEIAPEIEGAIAEAEAAQYQQALKAAETIVELIEAAQLDEKLPNDRTLFTHQKEGVSWLLSKRRGVGELTGGVLADQMGLGKTMEALVAAKAMQSLHQCPILVVCPATLQANWLREAEGVGVAIEVFSWAKMPKPLDTSKYVLIGDESHFIQNLQSQRTKNFLELAQHQNCLAVWALTGTPIKNGRPINLFPLLVATSHPLAKNRKEYERHFCAAREKSVGRGRSVWDNTGAAHLDELAKKTEDVILRRTKKECLDLPEKIRQLRSVELSADAEKTYNAKLRELVDTYKARVKSGEISDEAEALVTLGQLRMAGSVAKVEAAIEQSQDLLEQGESVILFTEFTESAKALHQALGGELLTGDTPVEERQSLVDRFQSGESKVFIGTIRAGGVGLTLTAASYVILVDRPWSPGEVDQAEDRAHRIGQKSTVNAIWLQHGAIDAAIDQLLETKQQRIELVLKGKRKTLRGLGSPTELAKELLALL